MKITFLGTGTSQGIPIIGSTHPVCLSTDTRDKRLRVSVLIAVDDKCFVIDCGPDFRQQMLANPIEKLDAILFTHEHSDHTAGLDDIRPFFFRQGDIPIYARKRVIDQLKIRFDYIFTAKNRYPSAPAVAITEIENAKFSIANTTITPIEVYHDKLPVFGFRIYDFAYLTDVKTVATKEMEKLKYLDVLVVSALRIDAHPSHFNLEEALNFIAELKPKKAYLTHISHLLGFHKEVSDLLPDNVFLAYDNLELSIITPRNEE